mmetsp:Transcript_17999/g.39231  ORF Transcript_17999/g.39231 Transcript_17999/m.39231 type:complete len:267 (-) Transcript_17999:197-997(-)
MNMNSSISCTDFSDVFDADPLHISGHCDFDEIALLLEEDDGEDDEVIYVGTSKGSVTNVVGPVGMNFQFGTLESCHAVQVGDHARLQNHQQGQVNMASLKSPAQNKKQQFTQYQDGQTNYFDLANYSELSMQSTVESSTQSSTQSSSTPPMMNTNVNRRGSESSTSTNHQSHQGSESSTSTIHQSHQGPDPSTPILHRPQQFSQIDFNAALQKFTESMQRSEMTRQHVMMQRSMLGPEQLAALYLVKEDSQQQAMQQDRNYPMFPV